MPKNEHPILFSTEMVRAILNGRKTQTRRVIKPQPSGIRLSPFVKSGIEDIHGYEIKIKYHVEDMLWVRETWADFEGGINLPFEPIMYKADDDTAKYKWRPSIYMPRWASRITLEITNVRVERVQEISEDDARQEGCKSWKGVLGDGEMSAREAFIRLWNSINQKRGYGWDVNPYVWVIEFEVMK